MKPWEQYQGKPWERYATETIDPTEGMSASDKFFAGVGKGMTDVARGIGQVIPVRRNGEWQSLVKRDDIAEARKRDAALMNTGAGVFGNVVGNIATALPAAFIPGANTVAGSAVIGAGMGALQPSTSTSETLINTGLGGAGGAAGQKIAQGVGRLMGGNTNANTAVNVSPGSAGANASVSGSVNTRMTGGGSGFGSVDPTDVGNLTEGQQAIMDWARSQGFRLTPGQASGSKALQQIEAKLESQPMTSGTFNKIKDANQSRLNQIAAKAIGEDASELSAPVLQRASDRIGGIYDMIRTDRKVPVDADDFLNRLSKVEGEFEGLLPVSLTDNPLVKRLFSVAESGNATQAQLATLTSKLNKAANNQMVSSSGDRELGKALFQVKDVVDDLLEGSMSGDTLKAFQKARGEYRNLMLLTNRQGVVNPSSGNVQGGALASALQQKDRRGFLFNQNDSDLYNAARFAQAFRPVVGDSGTATRSMVNNAMDLITQVPINVATSAYASSPVVNVAANMGRGVAPEVFTPELLRAMNAGGRTLGIGLLNSVQE